MPSTAHLDRMCGRSCRRVAPLHRSAFRTPPTPTPGGRGLPGWAGPARLARWVGLGVAAVGAALLTTALFGDPAYADTVERGGSLGPVVDLIGAAGQPDAGDRRDESSTVAPAARRGGSTLLDRRAASSPQGRHAERPSPSADRVAAPLRSTAQTAGSGRPAAAGARTRPPAADPPRASRPGPVDVAPRVVAGLAQVRPPREPRPAPVLPLLPADPAPPAAPSAPAPPAGPVLVPPSLGDVRPPDPGPDSTPGLLPLPLPRPGPVDGPGLVDLPGTGILPPRLVEVVVGDVLQPVLGLLPRAVDNVLPPVLGLPGDILAPAPPVGPPGPLPAPLPVDQRPPASSPTTVPQPVTVPTVAAAAEPAGVRSPAASTGPTSDPGRLCPAGSAENSRRGGHPVPAPADGPVGPSGPAEDQATTDGGARLALAVLPEVSWSSGRDHGAATELPTTPVRGRSPAVTTRPG